MDYVNWCVLPLSMILDVFIGDPLWLPHPVRWMGAAVSRWETFCRRFDLPLKLSGFLFAVTLVAGTWLSAWLVLYIAKSIHPVLWIVTEVILIYFCLAARSLDSEARSVYRSLKKKNLNQARKRVSCIVGREVDRLDENGVSRAAVETVAENLVDGIISPLFYAAVGGAPLCLAFKMVSTLDSMVGYKNDRYLYFGRSAALMDDIANYIPARLSPPVIALAAQILGGSGKRALGTALREGRNHASPNAGIPEAAFAGALGVKLGGPNFYHGSLVSKPYIGAEFDTVGAYHIPRACDLMMLSAFFSFMPAWCFSILKNWFLS